MSHPKTTSTQSATSTLILPRIARRAVPLVAIVAFGALAACGGDDQASGTLTNAPDAPAAADDGAAGARPAFGLVSTDQGAALAVDPGVVVIDVRTPEEFAEGHIEGATLVDFNAPNFADEIAKLPTDQPYLVYCRSDNRSGQAVAIMADLGFSQVWDLDGGVIEWASAGQPLVQ